MFEANIERVFGVTVYELSFEVSIDADDEDIVVMV